MLVLFFGLGFVSRFLWLVGGVAVVVWDFPLVGLVLGLFGFFLLHVLGLFWFVLFVDLKVFNKSAVLFCCGWFLVVGLLFLFG